MIRLLYVFVLGDRVHTWKKRELGERVKMRRVMPHIYLLHGEDSPSIRPLARLGHTKEYIVFRVYCRPQKRQKQQICKLETCWFAPRFELVMLLCDAVVSNRVLI